ncbi:MAG TPA: TIM barrel protein [Abditibacteriaceae bacterium]
MNITFSLFPKFYREYSPQQLAELVRHTGLDTVNLVVRDGYWCEPATVARNAPRFVAAMREYGIQVHFATTDLHAADIMRQPEILAAFAECGIRNFRLNHFHAGERDIKSALREVRRQLETLAPWCQKFGVRAVNQLHHHTLVSSPSAAFALVDGLPPEAISVELDAGNQAFEGFEDWKRSVELLGPYLSAVGVKDTALVRDMSHASDDDKGWRRNWAPLGEGVTNWKTLLRALHTNNFSGTLVFMAFYHDTEEAARTRVLGEEVAYLRRIIAAVESEGAKT